MALTQSIEKYIRSVVREHEKTTGRRYTKHVREQLYVSLSQLIRTHISSFRRRTQNALLEFDKSGILDRRHFVYDE